MVINERTGLRLGVVWKATLTRLNGEQLTGSTDNISANGLNIIIAQDLVVGEPVRVQLVHRCSGRLSCFDLQAVVVHVRTLADNLGCAIGMRLIEESPAYQCHFDYLLDQLEHKTLAS